MRKHHTGISVRTHGLRPAARRPAGAHSTTLPVAGRTARLPRLRRIAVLLGSGGVAAAGMVVAHAAPAHAATIPLTHWIVTPSGVVTGPDGAPNYGSTQYAPAHPIVGMAPTRDAQGYWLVGSDGGVYTFGDARFYGSTGNIHLSQPIVGMAPTPSGHGYWLVASDGGVFSFGDARFFGSTGNIHLSRPIVGMAPTPSGHGYWLVASDGGVFTFGDAGFHGSTGNVRLSQPIVGMAPTADGRGYWLVASDGGVFNGGDAGFYGSGSSGNQTVDGIVPAPDSHGYWLLRNDGTVTPFGTAASGSPAPQTATGPSVVPAGGAVERDTAGRQAVAFAMAQIGKPYVWGATGPSAYDCSGLTLRAWQSAGVTLPRVASDQYGAGTHVPVSAAEPGDLIFYATNPADPSTIYHVGVYIGDGQIVNATHPGSTVMVLPVGDISGLVPLATRP